MASQASAGEGAATALPQLSTKILEFFSEMKVVNLENMLWTVLYASVYIGVSSALITSNSYILQEGRFPHVAAMLCGHMSMTSCAMWITHCFSPSLFPKMSYAKQNLRKVLEYMIPLSLCFAITMYASNKAYQYCSVAFLQFCKEANVPMIFVLACGLGLQTFTVRKASLIGCMLFGISMTVHGEIHFMWFGFLIQICSQAAEILKNQLSEIVMTDAGIKLDALTFVTFQAPLALVIVSVRLWYTWTPQIMTDFQAWWPMLLFNALLASSCNVCIAFVIKRLSAVAFVIIGLVKDIFIVVSSQFLLSTQTSAEQRLGFTIVIAAIAVWSRDKLQEQEEHQKLMEPILPNGQELRDSVQKALPEQKV